MLTVIKLGGSVLTGREAYGRAAAFLTRRLEENGGKLLAIVSAEYGTTDALEALAHDSAPLKETGPSSSTR